MPPARAAAGASYRAGPRHDDSPRVPKRRRRARLSCSECRRRKRKCDGKLPCSDCKLREKPSGCCFEDGSSPATDRLHHCQHGSEDAARHSVTDTTPGSPQTLGLVDSPPATAADFGYVQAGANASTADLLERISAADPALFHRSHRIRGHDNGHSRYDKLVQELVSRRAHVAKLVDYYFREINWQYYILDEGAFREQLHQWEALDSHPLSTSLSDDMVAFPAMLLGVVGTSVLMMPSNSLPPLEPPVGYASSGMSPQALAMNYSASSVAILRLIGKRRVSLTSVFAGFIRTAFLKYLGQATEAWHALGETIKDAQEIGLHKDSRDPKPESEDVSAVLSNQWAIQDRRRIWMLLSCWDIHTAIVLGRPACISNEATVTIPVDAPLASRRSVTPVVPRRDDDPPTPLTRSIWAFRVMNQLRQIQPLEKEGAYPKDFSRVDDIDKDMRELEDQLPSYLRRRNPDTRFDSLPRCCWLQRARATLPPLIAFNLIALHRPYVFTRPDSRSKAVKACLDMLQAQREHFDSVHEDQHRTFTLFFGTFDAVVLMASIYIFFPTEGADSIKEMMQQFQWSVERFEAMSSRVALAKSALLTLHAIFAQLRKAIDNSYGIGFTKSLWSSVSGLPTPAKSIATQDSSPVSSANLRQPWTQATASGSLQSAQVPSQTDIAPLGPVVTGGDLDLDIDWAAIQPIYATEEISQSEFVGSLSNIPLPADSNLWATASEEEPFSFVEYADGSSIWNVLNQYK